MQRKENVEAENEFKETLKINPNLAQVSYWLGDVVLKQGDPNKNELALFSFARAAAYDREGSLNAQGREQVDGYLRKVYARYTGSEDGLDELKASARTSAFPPAGLRITSAEVAKFERSTAVAEDEEEWQTVAVWRGSGLKNTDDFTITSQKWRILWKTGGFLQVTIYGADGNLVDLAVNQQSGGEDASYHRGVGTYYLKINSLGENWEVAVQQ